MSVPTHQSEPDETTLDADKKIFASNPKLSFFCKCLELQQLHSQYPLFFVALKTVIQNILIIVNGSMSFQVDCITGKRQFATTLGVQSFHCTESSFWCYCCY